MALAVASLAIRILPFRRLAAMLTGREQGELEDGRCEAVSLAADIVRDVETAARRLPWRAVCFQKGLATHWMLRRRGIPSKLHYGVSQTARPALSAHVWVSVNNTIIIGGDAADAYACLATFPAQTGKSDLREPSR